MTVDQFAEVVRQVSAIAILLALLYALHKEWLVLGREYRNCEDRALKSEQKAEEWESFALRQLGISERAVGAAERVLPPRGGP